MPIKNIIKYFVPEIDSVQSPVLKQRLPFIAGANLIFIIFFILLVGILTAVTKSFNLYSVSVLVTLGMQIAAIFLIRRNKQEEGAYCLSVSLFISAAAIVFLFPITYINEMYRSLAYMLVMSICNLLITISRRQLILFASGTAVSWLLSIFTVHYDKFAADYPYSLGVLAAGILAILLANTVLMFIEMLALSLLKSASKESEKAQKALDKITNLIGQAKASLDIGVEIDKSANQVKESVASIEKLHSYLSKEGTALIEKTAHIQKSGATVMQKVTEMKANIQDQNAAITQTSAAITEISANITSISDIAGKRRESMNRILKNLDSQKNIMQKLRSEVENVRKSSEGIASFVKTVEDISSQTGLLAMNASIEAAHAGATGKGFAVISLEIRKLSDETRKNSAYISEVLKKNEETVNAASESVKEFAAYMESSTGDTKSTISSIEEILMGVSEMDIGTKEVMRSVKNIVERTRDTGQMVETVVTEIRLQKDEISVISEFSDKLHDQISLMKKDLTNIQSAAERVADEGRKNTELVTKVNVDLSTE